MVIAISQTVSIEHYINLSIYTIFMEKMSYILKRQEARGLSDQNLITIKMKLLEYVNVYKDNSLLSKFSQKWCPSLLPGQL